MSIDKHYVGTIVAAAFVIIGTVLILSLLFVMPHTQSEPFIEPQTTVFIISVDPINSLGATAAQRYMVHYAINGKAQTAFFCSIERANEFIAHLEGL